MKNNPFIVAILVKDHHKKLYDLHYSSSSSIK